MTNPERSSEPVYSNISELLLAVSLRSRELDDEAWRKLYEEQDAAGYRDVIFQRAQLIADLPSTIRSFKDKGGAVPSGVEYYVESVAGMAVEYAETGNTFGMSTLLIPMGSREEDPNDLERLAAQFGPGQDTEN